VTEEPTTPDLVELTRRWVDALNARDIDAAMNTYASDIVWEGALQTFEGRAALRGFFQDSLDAFDELEVAAEEIGDLGNGVAFGVFILRGRPRGSAGWVQGRAVAVATWVDGLVRRITQYFYSDIDEARAAAERLAEERG
jgi:ketosteroid isomerase-like protein